MSAQKEDFMTSKWRPMMAMTYMATIWFDFIIGPTLYNLLQYWNPGQAVTGYVPITLQGGGLYHISMGAILGIAAFTRGKEKIAQIEAGETNVTPQAPVMGLPVASAPVYQAPVAQAPAATPSFGEPPAFGSEPAAPATRATPTRKIT